jgi:hypothetical protein
MKDTLKTSIKAVIMLLCLFVSIVSGAGAINYGVTDGVIYIVAGIIQICMTCYCIYREIKVTK